MAKHADTTLRRRRAFAALLLTPLLALAAGTACVAANRPPAVASATEMSDFDGDGPQQTKTRPADAASRSSERTPVGGGSWDLGDDIDAEHLTRIMAHNDKVSAMIDADGDAVPTDFDPNHTVEDVGNMYAAANCTWGAYEKRHEMGLPVSSWLGNGADWYDSAKAEGYWVGTQPRHVGDIISFKRGQFGASAVYGHVAVISKLDDDGSFETIEMGDGRWFSRHFTAEQGRTLRYVYF